MTSYLIVNKHTQEVYAKIIAKNPLELKNEWARRCGHDNWLAFISEASIEEDDICIYRDVDRVEPDNMPDNIFAIAKLGDFSFFFVAEISGTTVFLWISNFGTVRETTSLRSTFFDTSTFCHWRNVPEDIRKLLKVELL